MSFLDLATLTLHRRNEMESRINVFTSKCDTAIREITKLKLQAQNFVHQLNCDPSELKERFLNCMKLLDEYTYLITDFNLSVEKLEQVTSIDYPVHDTSTIKSATPPPTFNIIDILSEPTPSTSSACPNLCPLEKPKKKKVPKEEQTLIMFSSASCSSESVPLKNEAEKKEKEEQCEMTKAMKSLNLAEAAAGSLPVETNLPAQTILQMEQEYQAIIMNVDGGSLWVITDNYEETFELIKEMTVYYNNHHVEMTLEDVTALTYCACYDVESDSYYRGLFIRLVEDDKERAEVFLVDTGEVRVASDARAHLQPLAPRFCARPPYARCCHLAGIELVNYEDKNLTEMQEEFLRQYIGVQCSIEVDDNTSESLGIYVLLSETETLNNLLIKNRFAISNTPELNAVSNTPTHGPPEIEAISDSELAMDGPEYEDPVEAVTGYSCRDEADICKHYKGGAEKTCFKGARCKKKHILKHPDGWTLDRVEVTAKCPSLPLPAPGSWLQVLVTCVPHFDRLYVQFVDNDDDTELELPRFGVILPPTNLKALVRDMNSPATRLAYKSLIMAPAPGELVAALYPCDGQWYRARVRTVSRADRSVEVMYIDYGNVVWVQEDLVKQLEPRHCALPAQAVLVALAGVEAHSDDSTQWAAAMQHLSRLTLNMALQIHVIGREYDEIVVEIYDEQGYNIAEQLAVSGMVKLKAYSVIDDTKIRHKQTVP